MFASNSDRIGSRVFLMVRAAAAANRASGALRIRAPTHQGAKIHDGLGIVGHAFFRCIGIGKLPHAFLRRARRQRFIDRVIAREHPFDVAVENGMACAVCQGQDRAGRGSTDAGQGADGIEVAWKDTIVPGHDFARGPVKMARPRVVT